MGPYAPDEMYQYFWRCRSRAFSGHHCCLALLYNPPPARSLLYSRSHFPESVQHVDKDIDSSPSANSGRCQDIPRIYPERFSERTCCSLRCILRFSRYGNDCGQNHLHILETVRWHPFCLLDPHRFNLSNLSWCPLGYRCDRGIFIRLCLSGDNPQILSQGREVQTSSISLIFGKQPRSVLFGMS